VATRQKIQIGEHVFASKAAAKARIRTLMAKYADGERLDQPADAEFVFSLLQRHRLAAKKIGVGVEYFTIRTVLPWRNRAFYIIRSDGSDVEFSFVECLSETSHRARFQNACREAIHNQIVQFIEHSLRPVSPSFVLLPARR
jgi:hypothetical protein